jgi:hypothetical protein
MAFNLPSHPDISETILSILTKLCPNVPWVILFQIYVRYVWGPKKGPRGGLKWLIILISVFLKHLTISTIRKLSATIQVYGLSNMSLVCLHWHQRWYTHDLSMSGNQLWLIILIFKNLLLNEKLKTVIKQCPPNQLNKVVLMGDLNENLLQPSTEFNLFLEHIRTRYSLQPCNFQQTTDYHSCLDHVLRITDVTCCSSCLF